jgi:hypothetical protein
MNWLGVGLMRHIPNLLSHLVTLTAPVHVKGTFGHG